jgi:capsular polysaccharide transport system permease protein
MQYFKTHIRVSTSFALREVATRYGKHPGGYIWALLEPVSYVVLMSFLFGALARHPALGTSFPLFFATGFIAFALYSDTYRYLTSSISANRALLSYPTVAPIDAFVGRFILQSITSLLVALVILTAARMTEPHALALNWKALLEAVFYAWALALGMAFFNAALFQRYSLYEKLYSIVTKPLLLLSGVFYVPSLLPSPFREYMLLNPLTHVVILLREGFYGQSPLDGVDRFYLAEWSACLLFVGMLTFTLIPFARER